MFVKFKKGCGGCYFDGGGKIYEIQPREKFSDDLFEMWKHWPGPKKEDYVYLIANHILEAEKHIKRKTRFVNKKYLEEVTDFHQCKS